MAYLESALAINAIIDAFTLLGSARVCGLTPPPVRLVSASVFASVYYLFTFVWNIPVAHFIAFIVMCFIFFPYKTFRLFVKQCSCTFCLMLVCAGASVILITYWKTPWLSVAAMPFAFFALYAPFFRKASQLPYTVKLTINGTVYNGMIDTGNLLLEPISLIPIAISRESFFPEGGKSVPVACRTLTGSSIEYAVLLDGIEINQYGRKVTTPPMYFIKSSSALPEGVDILLPPACLDILSSRRNRNEKRK